MAEKKEKPVAAEKETDVSKIYHMAKRADGKWQVKYAGGEKAIKLFATKEEAMKFTKTMAENQGTTLVVHASKGKFKGKIRSK